MMANDPLMALGLFTFGLKTAPFDTLRRTTSQRWASNNRVGRGPGHQWVGPGEDSITLEGVLMPELTGGTVNLDKLREMAATGKAWILVSGTGEQMGKWFIESVEESRSHHAGPGLPRRIGFTLQLKRYWGDAPEQLGALMTSNPDRGA